MSWLVQVYTLTIFLHLLTHIIVMFVLTLCTFCSLFALLLARLHSYLNERWGPWTFRSFRPFDTIYVLNCIVNCGLCSAMYIFHLVLCYDMICFFVVSINIYLTWPWCDVFIYLSNFQELWEIIYTILLSQVSIWWIYATYVMYVNISITICICNRISIWRLPAQPLVNIMAIMENGSFHPGRLFSLWIFNNIQRNLGSHEIGF